MQKNWIGKSHGLQFGLSLESSAKERSGIESLEVFTTRPDTIFGVTYCAIAPEHPLVQAVFATLDTQAKESIIAMQNTSAKDRAIAPKQGVDLGVKVIHPLTDRATACVGGKFRAYGLWIWGGDECASTR